MITEHVQRIWLITAMIAGVTATTGEMLSAEMATTTLNGLQIGIDSETGGLCQLQYPSTGVILEADANSAALVSLAYAAKGSAPLYLSTPSSRAQVHASASEVRITWDALGPDRRDRGLRSGNIVAEVRFRAAPDGRSVITTCRIHNQSDGTVGQILFPDFRGLRAIAGPRQTQARFGRDYVLPFAGPAKSNIPSRNWEPEQVFRPNFNNSIHCLRWFDFGGLSGGLSVWEKQWGDKPIFSVRMLRTEADPDQLRLSVEHRVTLHPGESWESGEIWLTPHAGGWAKGIEPYRDYVRKVNRPWRLPDHVRDDIAFLNIWMITGTEPEDPEGRYAVFRFEDLPKVARDAAQYGIHELVPWMWQKYFEIPYPINKTLGTKEELIKAIKECKQLGVNVSLFISVYTLKKEILARYDKEAAARAHPFFYYHEENIPHMDAYYNMGEEPTGYLWPNQVAFKRPGKAYPPMPFAQGSAPIENEQYLRDVESAFKEWFDLGVTSFVWDQFPAVNADGSPTSLVGMAHHVRKMARAIDPQSAFPAECLGNLEYESTVVDYTWNWGNTKEADPILNVLPAPRLNYNVDQEALEAKRAFCSGLYVSIIAHKPDMSSGSAMISDVPAVGAALTEMVPLRKQFLEYFVNGVNLGDSFLSEPCAGYVRVHQLAGKLLVIVLNDSERKRCFSLLSDLSIWLPKTDKWKEKYYDHRGKLVRCRLGQAASWVGATGPMLTGEFAFLEIEAQ